MDINEGILARDENQLILIYNSNSQIGKEALGYVTSAEDAVLSVDTSKTELGDTVWVDIASNLNCNFSDILSPEHPDAPDIESAEFDTDDWLKILKQNPNVFQKPILIKGDRFKQLNTASEALQFIEVDSAGIEQNSRNPDIQATTEGEKFVDD